MAYNPEKHHRRSIRLRDYDYTQNGAYFVTICILHRECLFGSITDSGDMVLNECGQIAEQCWNGIPAHFPGVELDAAVIMPNHIHGILVITDVPVGARHALPLQQNTPLQSATFGRPAARSLGIVVGSFKSAVSKQTNPLHDVPGSSLWQRNFYEKIIRNEDMLKALRRYVEANPMHWALDAENPQRREI